MFNYRGRESRTEFRSKRKEFDQYPIYLKQTLLHPDGINKVRNADFGNAFFVFDDLKTEGNLYYEDQEYYTALEFYEQVLTSITPLGLQLLPMARICGSQKKRRAFQRF